jgi:hypothetical protein
METAEALRDGYFLAPPRRPTALARQRREKNTWEWREPPLDIEPVAFPIVQQIASVCEQNVSRFGSPSDVHQFVNEMHQFVTMATSKAAPRQPKSRSGT